MPPTIHPAAPSLIALSPPNESRWGFYQFPDIWRAPTGELHAAVNVGHDALVGEHEPSWFYVSNDEGKSWQRTPYESIDQSPEPVNLPDGSQVAFGQGRFIYHYHAYGPGVQPWQWWPPETFAGVKPVSSLLMDGYLNHEYVLYNYDDIPARHKPFPMSWRKSPRDPWQHAHANLDAPDMLLPVVARAWWWDAQGRHYHEDLPHQMWRPWPRWGVTVLPDGTLLWPYYCAHPDAIRLNRLYCALALFASTDSGRTWRRRAMIADDTHLTTHGYSGDEHVLQVMPNGDLYCVMRTTLSDHAGASMHLAATRSTDQGFTWSPPQAIAPFSVTPWMTTLANGVVALAYGRPGVYVRASSDSGRTWSDAFPVVGPSENDLLKDRWWDVRYDSRSDNKISCGNIGAVVTGPNSFLLAYSDFQHRDAEGQRRKAVLTREFTVNP